jgi:hypothetical protein
MDIYGDWLSAFHRRCRALDGMVKQGAGMRADCRRSSGRRKDSGGDAKADLSLFEN